MTTHEQERVAAPHEYRLLDSPGGGTTTVTRPAAAAVPAGRR